MDVVVLLPAFVVAVVLISASPGPAMALILRRAALHGFRAAVPTVLGLEAGLYVWALLAVAGFAALVDEQSSRLRADLYDSGAAAAVLARWAEALESGASAMVEQATITSESETIAKYFARS